MSRKAYPAYKPSGVEWLGEIPEHWEEIPLKYSAKIDNSGCYGAEEGEFEFDVKLCTTAHISLAGKFLFDDMPIRSFSSGELDRYRGRPGDIFVVKSSGSNTNIISGKLALVQNEQPTTVFSNFLMRIRPSQEKSGAKFLAYLLSSSFTREKIHRMVATTTYPNINVAEYIGAKLPVPPLYEQQAIASLLDRETARIDSLIEKKQRQIELLQEKRSALISHAVTKGLDPNVPMKNSGIEWMGEIPEHWQVKRLKFMSTLQTGLTLGKKYEDTELVTRPYLRVANVQDGYLNLTTITEIELPSKDTARYELWYGDVLMTEGGDFDKLGRGYVWENQIPGCLHQNHIFAVRPIPKELNSHFLALVLTSFHGKNYFTSTSQQTTNLATTNSNKLRSFPLPLPPVSEQEEILNQLRHVTRHLDILKVRVSLSIEKLREYRTALISAAVTGKIDIREEPDAGA